MQSDLKLNKKREKKRERKKRERENETLYLLTLILKGGHK